MKIFFTLFNQKYKKMETDEIILTSKRTIKEAVGEAVENFFHEKEKKEASHNLLSVNQVRLKLGKSHSTVKKLIKNGTIKATADGRFVTEEEIKKYLKKE